MMTEHTDYDRTSAAWQRAQADAAQDAEHEAQRLDWSRIELLTAYMGSEPIGIWRNCWLEWSDNLIDDTVELVDAEWENETP